MKTAISIPNDVFDSADVLAKDLGVSRSELYSTAVAEFLAKHKSQDVTARLNEVLAGEDTSLDPVLKTAQARSVRTPGW